MTDILLAFFLIGSLSAGFVFNIVRQKYEYKIHENNLTRSKALMLPAKEIRRIISESNDKDLVEQVTKSLFYRKCQYLSYLVFLLSLPIYCVIKTI
ncbi:hypothetical protein SDC9_54707 [bioreactor metagenome]|uniref:Uncharacterized protein n=1 Tax=bioreactor metagenome TaxID=1076179 RepID=A0A644WWU8_9ZZZZ